MELPRTAFTVSLEHGQCSFASAELHKRTYELMHDPELTRGQTLYMLEEGSVRMQDSLVVPVTSVMTLEDGREVQLTLTHQAKKDADVSLSAITREDVALPLASFVRRGQSSECDYVQIGQEMHDEAFVLTPQDEYSRKVVVETMRKLLEKTPLLAVYGDLIEEAGAHFVAPVSPARAIFDYIVGNKVIKRDDILCRDRTYEYSKEAVTAAAFFVAAGYDEEFNYSGYGDATYLNNRKLRKDIRLLKEFLNNPSLRAIRQEEVPGSRTPVVRSALIYETCKRLGIDENHRAIQTQNAYNLLVSLDVKQQFDEQLGEILPANEQVINRLGRLANAQNPLSITERIGVDGTHGEIDYFVETERKGSSDHVSVAIRPTAQPDKVESIVLHTAIDRTAKPHMETDGLEELNWILGRVVAKHAARN